MTIEMIRFQRPCFARKVFGLLDVSACPLVCGCETNGFNPPVPARSLSILKFTVGLSFAVLVALSCTGFISAQTMAGNTSVFRNTASSVAYVGSKTCIVPGCHEDIGRTYFPTSHGQSMGPANSPTELARAPNPVTVHDAKSNRYYVVYQDGGNLSQAVYELDKKGRKTYYAAHKLDYVSGGENTGYSYIFRASAGLFQAPLSFYVNPGRWELSPGYSSDDPGFTRVITTSCLICHNGQPDPQPRLEGIYKDPPFRFGELGISCEACHGPGALHVQEMQAHPGRVLKANEVDTSIVNPAKLSPRLASDICQNCHQAGDAVILNHGKTFLDFRPGAPLSDTENIVKRPLTEKERAEANRLETQPPVRGSLEEPLWWKNSTLELSVCYQASHGRLGCSTCHSVHHTPKPEDKAAAYRAACLRCHSGESCKLKVDDEARVRVGDSCVECHMEKRPIAGIAHNHDTKHRIVRYPGQPLPDVAFEASQPDLPGLLWLNRPTPDAKFPDQSQLEAYWTVARKDPSLSFYWHNKLNELSKTMPNDPLVLNYLGAIALVEKKDNGLAADYFSRALKLGAEDPVTYLNLATSLHNVGRDQEAEAVLERGVASYPNSGKLVARLAIDYASDGQGWRALTLIRQYRKLFPEDTTVRDALKQIDGAGNHSESPGFSRGTSITSPR
jgi:hypothetical protein